MDRSARNPREELLDLLWKLEKSFGKEMLEKYIWFAEHGERGRDCTYALKSSHLFYSKHYEDVKEALLKVLAGIRKLEGDNYGR